MNRETRTPARLRWEQAAEATDMKATNTEFLTVLVAHEDTELRRRLISDLNQGTYNVLEAPDLPSMIEIVLTQTKPIHVLLTDASTDKRQWASRLKSHRPKMTVWFVENWQDA